MSPIPVNQRFFRARPAKFSFFITETLKIYIFLENLQLPSFTAKKNCQKKKIWNSVMVYYYFLAPKMGKIGIALWGEGKTIFLVSF